MSCTRAEGGWGCRSSVSHSTSEAGPGHSAVRAMRVVGCCPASVTGLGVTLSLDRIDPVSVHVCVYAKSLQSCPTL